MLLENLKQRLSVFELVPSGGGCFEVTVDGERIWSKLDTGEFPEASVLLDRILERVS